jgi:hypothetical protein
MVRINLSINNDDMNILLLLVQTNIFWTKGK